MIDYTYDALSRLLEADYDSGATVYTYGFDVAGNLTNMDGASRTYNAANQMTHDGTNSLTYDANGNLTNDGVNSYVWDRANRLLSMGGVSYQYNGDGNRVSQDALNYILDLQPGLAQVIGDSDGNRYVHGPRGIHAQQDTSNNWEYMMQDGLNSVRGYVGANNTVESSISYSPVGVPDTSIIGPAFTGEWRDETELTYLRARYLSPNLGVWASLDPEVCGLRWKIEQFHRESKQTTGIEGCQCRLARMQRNHIACAILVWVRLKQVAQETASTIYQLKQGLLNDYLRSQLRSPAIKMQFA